MPKTPSPKKFATSKRIEPYNTHSAMAENMKIVYYNATPFPLNYLVQDPDGDVEGRIGDGPLTKFSTKMLFPKDKEIHLLREESEVRFEHGIAVADFNGWDDTDLDMNDLPTDADLIYLIATMPAAQFLMEKREQGLLTVKPPVKTIVWSTNSGPTSAVSSGTRILGVTKMECYGELRLKPQ